MFEWLTQRFRKPKIGTDLLDHIRSTGKCPDCRDGTLLVGPEGGSAINVRCAVCKSEFNIGYAFGEPYSVERI